MTKKQQGPALKLLVCSVAWLLLLLSCLLSPASADCSTYVPSNTELPLPQIPDANPNNVRSYFNLQFAWSEAQFSESCDLRFQVLVAESTVLQVTASDMKLCEVDNQAYCLSPNVTGLVDGTLYVWVVRAVVNVTLDRGFIYDYGDISYGGFFKWCVPINPGSPVLHPTNATFPYKSDIVFSWDEVDFGDSCLPKFNYYELTIFQPNKTPQVFQFSDLSHSYEYITLANQILSPGVWFWSVKASNNLTSSSSVVSNFTVLEPEPIPCDPPCVANQGACNTTVGFCQCTPPFYGSRCEYDGSIVPTDAPQPPPLGLIIGLSVAGFVVIVVIVVMIVVFMMFKRKHQDVEMNILIEPPEFDEVAFEPYDLKGTPFMEASCKKNSWKTFEQLILAEDFVLVHALLGTAKVVHLDLLCSSLVIAFESHGAGASLVQRLMIQELHESKGFAESHEANPMPFRGDSAATKAFKVYCRLVGLPYLFETLGQILNDFCALLDGESKKSEAEESPENKSSSNLTSRKQTFTPASMEVDPNRMTSQEDETTNRLALQLICQKIFVKIHRSTSIFPREIRILCKRIRDESARLENLRGVNLNVLLSNLVFLRFINPSIIMPRQFGLVKEEPSDGAKRQLVLVTKVLQNLAAGVEFGKKESFMTKLNDFIRSNSSQMSTFLSELTENIDANTTPPQIAVYSAPISQFRHNAALANLYEFMFNNQEALEASLRASVSPSKSEALMKMIGEIYQELGNPAPTSKK